MMGSKRFIHEPISVEWDRPPDRLKDPPAPDRFTWRGETFDVVEILSEWRDYSRRGRMGRNMRPEHLERAAQRGSWGVGQTTWHLRVAQEGRAFELYYDRQPKGQQFRTGQWFLVAELFDEEEPPDQPA
jgi:hypothetical protein